MLLYFNIYRFYRCRFWNLARCYLDHGNLKFIKFHKILNYFIFNQKMLHKLCHIFLFVMQIEKFFYFILNIF